MMARTDDHAPLEAQDLGVRYGRTQVARGVSLQVAPGQVYALLGRNGAGKTSLVRCLLGWQAPSEGRALLWGQDAWSSRTRAMARVGVVQEAPEAPPRMRVADVLAFSEALYPAWDRPLVEARLGRAGIEGRARAGSLSRGQKTQLALALALAHGPELLVLDDPTLGLDAVARRSFFELLVEELAQRQLTVLLCTHDLAGAEGVVDRVGILDRGELVVDEAVEALKARVRRVRWAPGAPRPGGLDGLGVLREHGGPFGHEALVSAFREDAAGTPGEPLSLEEIFIALTDPSQEVRA